jgi:CheY-like chemotaxis protein
MSKYGPIVLAEDDADDREILKQAFNSLQVKNKLLFFDNGEQVIHYLKTTLDQPFIIISDINFPKMNGLDLRKHINADEQLKRKAIPFVYLSTTCSQQAVDKAYELMVQGYFVKEDNINQVEQTLRMIIDYWSLCRHPHQNN